MPFIRTCASIVASAVSMDGLWAIWIALLGYSLGSSFRAFEGVDHYSTSLVLAFFFPGLAIDGPSVVREPREIVSWVGACLARRRLPET
jgi:hypothetical protein